MWPKCPKLHMCSVETLVQGYPMAGLRAGDCFCDNSFDAANTAVDESLCSFPCDDPNLMCGGPTGPGGNGYVGVYEVQARAGEEGKSKCV